MKNKALIAFLILFTFISLAPLASAGTETQLTKVASNVGFDSYSHSFPIFSPNGNEILFYRNMGLYKVSSDGSGEKLLSSGSINNVYKWSPDGKEILFDKNKENYLTDLYEVSSDGSAEKKLASNASEGDWSLDGSKISYYQDTKDQYGTFGYAIRIMKADGTQNIQLLDPVFDMGYITYSWFPSSSKLAYSIGTDDTRITFGVINSDGSNNQELNSGNANGKIAVSPDESKVAYQDWDVYGYPSCENGYCNLLHIHQINVQNINQDTYITFRGWDFSWFPDSSKIVYLSDENGHDDIYSIKADGTGKTQLTSNSANDSTPIISPDGSKILYVSDKTGNDDIWVMDVDGKNKVQLTTDPAKDSSPVWSPDSKKIAFYSERGGDHAIYVLDLSEEVITVGQGASTPEITQKFIEACDRNGGLSVIGNPTTKVHSAFGFEVQDFPELPATSGGVIMYNPNNKTAYFIHGAIWDKYYAYVDKAKLGPIASDEQIAAILPRTASGYLPLTKSGNYTKFETGTIHWISDKNNENLGHSQRGKSFVTYGALDEIYTKLGGTYSELGFPIMDQETKAEGYDYCEFDGGNISCYDSVTNYKIQFNNYVSYSDFSFVQITDVHVGDPKNDPILEQASLHNIIYELNNYYSKSKPKFVLVTGDLVFYDSRSLKAFFDTMRALNMEKKYVPGNHDRRTEPTGVLLPQSLNIYRSLVPDQKTDEIEFDESGFKFIGLDSQGDYNVSIVDYSYGNIYNVVWDNTPESWGLSPEQIEYLKQKTKSQPKIIFMHHPAITKSGTNDVRSSIELPTGGIRVSPEDPVPYNNAYGGNDGCIAFQRPEFIEYCKDNNVQLVLTGHTHKDAIISAGGNALREDIAEYPQIANSYPLFIQTAAAIDGYYRIVDVKDGIASPRPSTKAEYHEHWTWGLACPANLHAYDSQNRYTGLNSLGEIEIGIPDSFYTGRYNYSDPNEAETISAYNINDNYRLEIVANLTEEQKNSPEIETFNFTIEKHFNEDTNTTISYHNVLLTDRTTATILINSTTKSYGLEIDSDGDGVKDNIKEPDSIIINGVETVIVDNVSPSSITSLQYTNGTTWLNWTWTNPTDPDFNHTEIYLNGTFQTNTSAEYFNATNLQPETSYTLSTRTVDNYGNVNETWVNSTETTGKKVITIPIFPGCTKPPLDPNNDALYEDINGNGRLDFADVVTYYNNMSWITQNSLVAYFDYNRNGRIDFNDVVRLYNLH